jgi:hypothetical protein
LSKLKHLTNSIPATYDRASFVKIIEPLVRQVDDLSEGRKSAYHGEVSAAPTIGEHVRGDWVKNSLPDASGYFGWICIASGTPGTWKGFGLIAA